MKKFVISLLSLASAKVIELTSTNGPQQALLDFKYVVVNFYTDSSTKTKDYFADAEKKFVIPDHITIGFAQVNLDKYPEFKFPNMDSNTLPV